MDFAHVATGGGETAIRARREPRGRERAALPSEPQSGKGAKPQSPELRFEEAVARLDPEVEGAGHEASMPKRFEVETETARVRSRPRASPRARAALSPVLVA